MESNPTFSIIIPCYNYGHFLANALESVLIQKRLDIQILVIDDASDDDTQQVAQKYSKHIQYVRNEKNLGAGGAWGVGLELASGKYLLKLDADDELLPGHLEAMERAFESDKKIGIVLASVQAKNELLDTIETEYVSNENKTLSPKFFRQKFLESFFFRMPGCALRREITLGKEGPDPDLFQTHDWEYFLRVTKGHKARLLTKPLAIYRIHENSITAEARKDERLLDDFKRWLSIAEIPGERYINKEDRKVLRGSFACLLLYGFGSKLNPLSYLRFIRKYFSTFSIALGGGHRQVSRMHRALSQRILQKINANS